MHRAVRGLGQCLHERFEEQARRMPDAPAVVFEGQCLSYAALNTRADRLAQALRRVGVGPDVTVAVFVERSLDLAVALLGVLKAGGAYVPLDPDHRSQRQALAVQDCQAAVFVTQRHLEPGPLAGAAHVVYVDESEVSSPVESNATTETAVRPEHLAYVLYTSGTTGKPKGVAIEHRQVVSYLLAAAKDYGLAESANFAMAQSIAVDTCVTSLFTPMLFGRCLHILSREHSLDPESLAGYCRHNPIDCLKIAPSHLATLLEFSDAADLLPRRHLLLGGEPPSWRLIEQVRALRPGCAIFNEYGPTETTVGVITARLNAGASTVASPPIGRPIGGNRALLLDDALQPVAGGVEGELFIGGDQLARGYFERPALTAQAFIADPTSDNPGARLYRTGDRARRLPDGNLEYTGRADRQIKIRGFRIEPQEVESVLCGHAAVRQAVVESFSDESSSRRLVAYVTCKPDTRVTAAQLLRVLRQRLPEAMVPTAVLLLDALPLLPQGKLDRAALPAPQAGRTAPAGQLLAPRTPTEASLLDIWQNVLGVAPIGVDEDFLALGGDSLLASTLVMRLRRALGRRISLAALFAAPTIEALARTLGDGSAADDADDALQPIVPEARGAESPLSFGQERIWFIQRGSPKTVAYSYGVKFRFVGPLSVPILERCLSEELRRHEIYRTSFHDGASGPTQRVHPAWPVALPLVDLTDWPSATREDEAARRIDELLIEPFRLDEPSLVRWTLFRLDAHTHWLLHLENHLVHDGWASDLFFQELFDLYNAFVRGQPSPLADPPIQYADFARWEKAWIHGPEAARQRAYWRRMLSDCECDLALPVTRRRPARPSYHGARLDLELKNTLWQQVCALARHESATPFMVMLAAFYVLLSHYTGQTDINLGTGAANRRRPELAGVLGMFINNLVLRLDLSGNPSFRVLIARVRETALEAIAHQELPFNAVVEAVAGKRRDLSRNPIYQVMFSFHDTPMPDLSVPDLRVTMEPSLDTSTAKFDLNVIVYPSLVEDVPYNLPATDRPTWMIWEYSQDLFDSPIIERMADHYLDILQRATARPDAALAELSPLQPEERRKLVEHWSTGGARWPVADTVHGLFEAQASKTPEAVAIAGQQNLTYRELDERANSLAETLRAQGVEPGSTVALHLNRSADALVAMLAVLKAGAAYLPLDTGYPAARLVLMLEDAGASLILTQSGFRTSLPPTPCPVLELDHLHGQVVKTPGTGAHTPANASSLAYIMYTSGSTGQPKGVEIRHSGIVSLVFGVDGVQLDEHQAVLQAASLVFDASTWEIWAPLLRGGRCVLLAERMPTPASLARTIRDHGVTTMFLTTTLFNRIVDDGVEALQGVAQLLTGGEAASLSHIRRAVRALPETRIFNCYGPTECTTLATCCPIAVDLADDRLCVPIGRPVSGRRIYILDRHGHPAPVGVPGELWIGGAGLASGYRGRPALTAERFLPDPFGAEPGERLYRTGDRARFMDDGSIEFLGRVDAQIKLRGYRIEPAEIETTLARHPEVDAAAVSVRESSSGEKRLLAFFVAHPDTAPSKEALRTFLRERLPSFMLPSDLLRLDSLPLTAGGKIDRNRLPEAEKTNQQASSVTPRTALERAIAAIWSEVLECENVGVHDNFFDMGGHSLAALRMIARIHRTLGVDIPLETVFQNPTVAELGSACAQLSQFE